MERDRAGELKDETFCLGGTTHTQVERQGILIVVCCVGCVLRKERVRMPIFSEELISDLS